MYMLDRVSPPLDDPLLFVDDASARRAVELAHRNEKEITWSPHITEEGDSMMSSDILDLYLSKVIRYFIHNVD